jgi:hypothetical protein
LGPTGENRSRPARPRDDDARSSFRYVIKRDTVAGPIYLKTVLPTRWGLVESALRFLTIGDARRAITRAKLAKNCLIEELAPA